MMKEIFILLLVVAGFCSAIAAYLAGFHGNVTMKDVLSNAFAGTVGFYVGRYVQKGLMRNG